MTTIVVTAMTSSQERRMLAERSAQFLYVAALMLQSAQGRTGGPKGEARRVHRAA
jgi:hypothetical protein